MKNMNIQKLSAIIVGVFLIAGVSFWLMHNGGSNLKSMPIDSAWYTDSSSDNNSPTSYTYNINASAGGGVTFNSGALTASLTGTVVWTGTGTVTVTFYVVPKTGYAINTVTSDGHCGVDRINNRDWYIIGAFTGNCTVTATFKFLPLPKPRPLPMHHSVE